MNTIFRQGGGYPGDTNGNYQISANVGFDYETSLGFIGGIDLFEQDLLWMLGEQARPYSRILGFTIGYNFAKLFTNR